MNRTSKIAFAAFLLALGLIASPRPAAAAGTTTDPTAIPQTDIKGGSTDDKHKDWIEVVIDGVATAFQIVL